MWLRGVVRARVGRPAMVVMVAVAALVLAGCEKPDASHVTSPSALALIGTTEGAVSYAPEGMPSPPVAAPEGWEFDLGNVRFAKLENDAPALQVVTQVKSRPGTALELWVSGTESELLRWSGGSTREYNGVMCFMLRLEDDGEALQLHGEPYRFTMTFRDAATGAAVVSDTIEIAGFAPGLDGSAPGEDSGVARDLLGCPRSVI